MKNIILTRVILIGAALILVGCQSLTPEALAKADYGEYPANYEQVVKEGFGSRLKDPYSAVYSFKSGPRKGWAQDGLAYGGKVFYGYIVEVKINAKNSYGGFIGEQTYFAFIRDGRMTDTVVPGAMAGYGPQ